MNALYWIMLVFTTVVMNVQWYRGTKWKQKCMEARTDAARAKQAYVELRDATQEKFAREKRLRHRIYVGIRNLPAIWRQQADTHAAAGDDPIAVTRTATLRRLADQLEAEISEEAENAT